MSDLDTLNRLLVADGRRSIDPPEPPGYVPLGVRVRARIPGTPNHPYQPMTGPTYRSGSIPAPTTPVDSAARVIQAREASASGDQRVSLEDARAILGFAE